MFVSMVLHQRLWCAKVTLRHAQELHLFWAISNRSWCRKACCWDLGRIHECARLDPYSVGRKQPRSEPKECVGRKSEDEVICVQEIDQCWLQRILLIFLVAEWLPSSFSLVFFFVTSFTGCAFEQEPSHQDGEARMRAVLVEKPTGNKWEDRLIHLLKNTAHQLGQGRHKEKSDSSTFLLGVGVGLPSWSCCWPYFSLLHGVVVAPPGPEREAKEGRENGSATRKEGRRKQHHPQEGENGSTTQKGREENAARPKSEAMRGKTTPVQRESCTTPKEEEEEEGWVEPSC